MKTDKRVAQNGKHQAHQYACGRSQESQGKRRRVVAKTNRLGDIVDMECNNA